MESTVAVAHQEVGTRRTAVVSTVDAPVGKAYIDVGVSIAVEVGDGDEACVVDRCIAVSLCEGSVAIADPGQNGISGAQNQIEFAVVIQISGCEVRTFRKSTLDERECWLGSRRE